MGSDGKQAAGRKLTATKGNHDPHKDHMICLWYFKGIMLNGIGVIAD